MLVGSIDFPQGVIDSHRDGKLVVFAGAGVSNPDPSNLDDFERLADRIGVGSSPRADKEPPDEYLGRLHDLGEGVEVYELAATFSSIPSRNRRIYIELFCGFSIPSPQFEL